MDLKNLNGQTVFSRLLPPSPKHNETLDLSWIPKGLYYAFFRTDNSFMVKKLIRR
jgi:hypothetical protein